MPEQGVTDRLTSFYRAVDAAIPERAPAWQLDTRPAAAGGLRFQLLATAALLVLVAVVAILITEARLHSSTQPAHPGPGSPLRVTLTLKVQPMGFQDSRTGWVVSAANLLMTTDGGRNWRDVTPAGARGSCCAVFFLDRLHGWAGGGYDITSRMVRIYRTADGGMTWRQVGAAGPAQSQYSCCSTLSFVDQQHGWLMHVESAGVGSPGNVGKLLRTTDGGASWSPMRDLPATPASHLGGVLPEMTLARFVSVSTGWYVGTNGGGEESLYRTADGGQTWTEQAVPIPAYELEASRHLSAPTFLNGVEGVLPITLDDGTVVLDFSNDGGVSWHMDTARAPLFHRPPDAQSAGQYDLAPTFIGNGVMAVVLGDQLEVNSGSGWSTVSAVAPGVIIEIQFVDAKQAWALTTCPEAVCPSGIGVVKSTDGGHTWIQPGP